MNNLKMSKSFAYLDSPMMLIVKNNKKIGYRCSIGAFRELNRGKLGSSLYSVKVDDEVIWVSVDEFKENNLIEHPIPWDRFKG